MAPDDDLLALWGEVSRWRRETAPRTRDDLTRLPRPAGWLPDWRSERVASLRREMEDYAARLAAVPAPSREGLDLRRDVVDRYLVGSLLARVHFELDVVAAWRRDPWFYLDQSLGLVYDALLRPPPFTDERVDEVLSRLASVPATLEVGKENLRGACVTDFALLALRDSRQGASQLRAAMDALGRLLGAPAAGALSRTADDAAEALERWRSHLEGHLAETVPFQPIGEEGLAYFLRHVALVPEAPDELLRAAAQEWDRAVAFELLEEHRDPSPLCTRTVAPEEQVARHRAAEEEVRAFYESHDLLTQSESLRHYLNLPRPDYLEPLAWLGVSDDLTEPERAGEDAISYVPSGEAAETYFYRANLLDPRAGIAHEGAHAEQLALAWTYASPVRTAFFDSVPNEGIAFYNEEMLLRAGLFEDAPGTRRVIYNFMRLRALRVEIDLGLALGRLSVDEAASHLCERVPMEEGTAREEAAFFASTPGQGMSYCVGKLQILSLLAECRRAEGAGFSLRAFHDWLFVNGNVPIALLRYERLGDPAALEGLGATALSPSPAVPPAATD